MADRIHAIVAEHPGYGWSITSPQLPELVGGRTTRIELDANLREIVRFGGAGGDIKVIVHEQAHYVTEDGDDYAIRLARDSRYLDRLDTLRILLEALERQPDFAADYFRSEYDPVFVVMTFEETVGDLLEQMDDRGDFVVCALPVVGSGVATTAFVAGDQNAGKGLSDFGLSAESPVSELLTKLKSTDFASEPGPAPVLHL